jgi:hypothetical protein
MRNFVFLLTLGLFFHSCVPIGISSKYNIEELSFGSGGGFTGNVTMFRLTSDGTLYKNENFFKKISKKKLHNLYHDANTFKDFRLNSPDNIYSFIHIKSKMSTNRIVWSISTPNMDSNFIHLYKNLMSLTK